VNVCTTCSKKNIVTTKLYGIFTLFTTLSPTFVGFFVCGMMSRFKNDNFFIIGKKKIIMMKYLLKKDKK